MNKIVIVLVVISFLSICNGQEAAFFEFNTSRYARVVSLANAYTGLADDIETVYYNSAGLAALDYYSIIYSSGQGYTFVSDDYTADNIAVLIPTFSSKIGNFAISVDRLNFNNFDPSQEIYRLHYARAIYTNLFIGTSINYYHFYANLNSSFVFSDENDKELTGRAFDASLSALYIFPNISIPGLLNETRIGFQMQNLFDTDFKYSGNSGSVKKHQTFRAGISTTLIPELPRINNLNILKLIIVADAVFYGSNYDFILWQPNFGIEMSVIEFFKLRYGRENEEELKNYYENSPQHPVKRYGLGLDIPIHKFIPIDKKVELSIDYSYSDWDRIDESKPFLGYDIPIRESYSIKISVHH